MDNGVTAISRPMDVPGGDRRIAARLQATLTTVRSCIRDVCGEAPAMAVEHFAPSVLALRDPRRYERSLTRLAPGFAWRVIAAVEAAVAHQEGVELRESEPLFEFMERVGSKGGMRSVIEA